MKTATPINRQHATKAGVSYALLFFGCLVFHIAGTWSLPLIDRDEPRFAEASREMTERSDYVVPRFNNQLRLDKPPLAYWMQVASYRIFGENDFAARFPSAIAAALIALSIFGWGTQIGGQKVGWWAAIIFTLSLQTFVHAKAAVADMWLILFMTIAYWSGYELLHDRPSSSTNQISKIENRKSHCWWIFYSALAFAFLAKGPIGWTPLLTVAATIFFAPNLQLRSRFKFIRGILLMLAIVALWAVPALIRTQGEFFRIGIGRHVVGRSLGAMEGHGANSLGLYFLLVPFYFVMLFLSFFPWSIKLPRLSAQLWRNRDDIDNYLLAGAGIIFIIFSLIKTKLPHYTLPAFPLLSLLLARYWVRERLAKFKTIAIATACLWLAIALIVGPFTARFFPARQLYRESHEYLRPEMQFGAVDYNEPSLVWYFRPLVKGWMKSLNAAGASQFMAEGGPRFVVLPTKIAAKIFPDQPPNWKTFSARGFNIAKGKCADLTLVLKTE